MEKYKNRKTHQGINIEERIKSGMTKFFISLDNAMEYAEETSSYYYPCNGNNRTDKNDVKSFHVGYCVPK